MQIDRRHPAWLPGILARHAEESAGKLVYTFLTDGEHESENLTYRCLFERSLTVAYHLRTRRLVGERALLLYPPGLEFAAAFFGCLFAGVIAVPCHLPTRPRHLPKLLGMWADCQPAAVLSQTTTLERLDSFFEEAGDERLRQICRVATETLPLEDADGLADKAPAQEIAFLQYTSGSTSDPKGVIITHRNLVENLEMIRRSVEHDSTTIMVGWLPTHHDMGLIGNLLQAAYVGGRCVLMPPTQFLQHPARWLGAVSNYRAQTSGGPNFAYEMCLDRIPEEQRAGFDLSNWRVAFNGAEPVRADTIERFSRTFESCGFRREAFYPCYGMAEATLFVSGGRVCREPVMIPFDRDALEQGAAVPITDSHEHASKLVGCGHTWMDQEVAIFDAEARKPVADGRIGEIWLAGPNVTPGYWNRPDHESHVCAESPDAVLTRYLRTGDLGFVHSGELFIAGRLKDLIIVRGRNFYPQDLELTAERAHAGLEPHSGAAFSIDVGGSEEVVLVHELRRAWHSRAEEVAEAVRDAVAAEFEISLLDVVLLRPGSFPRTTSGKVQRSRCRAAYLARTLEVVGAPAARKTAVNGHEERSSSTQAALEEIWQELLGVSSPAAADDFFDAGGHSLTVTRLVNRIRQTIGVDVPESTIFRLSKFGAIKAEIDRLRLASTAQAAPPPIPAYSKNGYVPLSFAQERIWLAEQLNPRTPLFTIPIAFSIEGELEPACLERCLRSMIDRHDVLRSYYLERGGRPVAHIAPSVDFRVPVLDLSGYPASTRERAVRDTLVRAACTPFDIGKPPLLRAALLCLSRDRHVLLLNLHHMVCDLWSTEILLREFAFCYSALARGEEPRLGPVELQYDDFAQWERARAEAGGFDHDIAFWREKLRGADRLFGIPTDHPRPQTETMQGAILRTELPHELAEALRGLEQSQGVTLYVATLTAFKLLLSRYSSRSDVIVGTDMAVRDMEAIQSTVGLFVNQVALRTDLGPSPTFETALRQVRQVVLEAMAHRCAPVQRVTEEFSTGDARNHARLFRIRFGFQSFSLPSLDRLPFRLELLDTGWKTSKHDLSLVVRRENDKLSTLLEYRTDLFEEATVRRILTQYQRVLEQGVRDPRLPIQEYLLASEPAQHRLASVFNEEVEMA